MNQSPTTMTSGENVHFGLNRNSQTQFIFGATGTGKAYLACALGNAANRNYYETKYIRLKDLLTEIALSRSDGIYRDVMKKHKKPRLLILDE